MPSFGGVFVAVIIGTVLSMILKRVTTDETMKKKIRDHDAFKAKQIEEMKAIQFNQKLNQIKNLNIKCPTCGSNDVDRISTGKKLAYVATVGILAPAFKKVRSQFQCRECRYKW